MIHTYSIHSATGCVRYAGETHLRHALARAAGESVPHRSAGGAAAFIAARAQRRADG